MARIRTTKPEFWTSEQVVSCSRDARLLFIGMWNFCDDAGIHPKSLNRLKMEILPGDDCTIELIKIWIEELICAGLIIEYCSEGKSYWLVTGWKHQKIDKPTYRYPTPESNTLGDVPRPIVEDSKSIHQPVNEPLMGIRQTFTHGEEGIVREGIKEDGHKVSGETSLSPIGSAYTTENECLRESNIGFDVDTQILAVFQYWQEKMNHPRSKLDNSRLKRIRGALNLGFNLEQLKQAIDGCANNPFNMGENANKQRYDSIDLIFRDAEHIERFIRNAGGNETEHAVSQIDQISEGAI